MALKWYVDKIKDHDVVTTDPRGVGVVQRWHPATLAIAEMSLLCGYDGITDDNLDEVWHRVAAYQKVNGPAFRCDYPFGDVYLTRADLAAHVGLRTNASTMTLNRFYAELHRRDSTTPFEKKNTFSGPVDFITVHDATAIEVVQRAADYEIKAKSP